MSEALLKARHGVQLRATSGALSAVDRPLPLVGLGGYRRAIIHIIQEAALTTPDGDDRVRFHLETAYGVGAYAASGELLTADITAEALAVGVDDTTTFVVGDVIQVDNERMRVTASDGAAPGDLTVERGFHGDAQVSHLNNAVVNLLDVDWVEVAQVTYDSGDNGTSPECVIVIGSTAATPIILDDLDAALADNTILAAPLGDRLRLRTTIAGATAPTYSYSARAALQN